MATAVRRILILAGLTVAAVLVAGAAALALGGHRVSGSSMAPTLTDGELLAANPFDRQPSRFDVVLVTASESTSGAQELVKRVIGLPGDRIEILPAVGGGEPVIRVSPAGSVRWSQVRSSVGARPWRTGIECCAPDGRTSSRPAPATVPPGRYFVLGDNPDASIDSRTFGWVAAEAVRGVVLGRLWPPAVLSDRHYHLDPAGR